MNCGTSRKEECSEECAMGKSTADEDPSTRFPFRSLGNTEEEMEEYTEMFEHIEEYRSNAKKSPKKSTTNDDDDDESDTTSSNNESDASSEEEDEPVAAKNNKKSKATKKH